MKSSVVVWSILKSIPLNVGNTGGSTVYASPLSQERESHWIVGIYPEPVGTWAVTFNLT